MAKFAYQGNSDLRQDKHLAMLFHETCCGIFGVQSVFSGVVAADQRELQANLHFQFFSCRIERLRINI